MILFIQTSALYKSFTYLLTYLVTYTEMRRGRGSARNPAGEFTALPRPFNWILVREKNRDGREGKGKGEREGGKGDRIGHVWTEIGSPG